MGCLVPPDHEHPSFPSLYNPLFEIWKDQCKQDPRVSYLIHPEDIFRFTLYWTLLLYLFVFGLPGLWALIIHFLPRNRARQRRLSSSKSSTGPNTSDDVPYTVLPEEYAEDLNTPTTRPKGLTTGPMSAPGHLRFASPASGVQERDKDTNWTSRERPPAKTWDSWSPSIRLRNLRARQPNSGMLEEPPTPARFSAFQASYQRASALIPTPAPAATPAIAAPYTNNDQGPLLTAYPPPQISPHSRIAHIKARSTGLTLVLLSVPILFLISAAVLAVIGSLVIGYLLAALGSTMGVRISTWLPLGWAAIQASVVVAGAFPEGISFM